jgi:hypothetical protein
MAPYVITWLFCQCGYNNKGTSEHVVNIFLFENILCFLFKKLIFTVIKISKIHENG